MTLSVLVVDPPSGLMGVAVATHPPAVGARVPALLPNVGIAVTQGITEPALAGRVLAARQGGASPDAALSHVLATDPHAAWRQVALLTAGRQPAIYTGENSFGDTCAHTGEGIVVVGNMLASTAAGPAAEEAFSAGEGTMHQRLAAALRAGDAAGGDRRGITSAAMLVGPIISTAASVEGAVDLRVDSAPDPISVLDRLISEHAAHLTVARLMSGIIGTDPPVSMDEAERALETRSCSWALATDITFWAGAALVPLNEARASQLLREVLASEPHWRAMLEHLVATHSLPEHVLATTTPSQQTDQNQPNGEFVEARRTNAAPTRCR